MKYNVNGLNRLVKMLCMQLEVERLREAGLSNEQLAEVFDEILNPDSSVCNAHIRNLFFGERKDFHKYGKRGYIMVKRYFGIGNSQDYKSINSFAELEGLNRIRAFHYINLIKYLPMTSSKYIMSRLFTDERARGQLKKQVYYKALERVLSNN